MNNKFIFDIRKCVGCRACSVACKISNSWKIPAREIFVFNKEVAQGFPVISISMACNHCENPVCLSSCPSSAISRDDVTGAILLEPSKCFGCKYCLWNCPFDAPKYDITKKSMSKCDLCYLRIRENKMPACANACPTGALTFGLHDKADTPSWMLNESIGPSVVLKSVESKPPEIIPERRYQNNKPEKKSGPIELSLLLFTFLSAASVTWLISSFLNAVKPGIIPLLMIFSGGLFSMFHLGKPFLSWRSIINIRTSSLSREIVAYLIYLLACLSVYIMPGDLTVLAGVITGLLLLVAIDRVYIHVDGRSAFHSGQVLLITMTAIPFFSFSLLPLLFITVIRLFLAVPVIISAKSEDIILRFLRLAFLIIAVTGKSSGLADNFAASILFIAGELIDRYFYYRDFDIPFFMRHINSEPQTR